MSRIYITGDLHGPVDFAKIKEFAKCHPSLTKDDYLVILGDFGLLWDTNYKEEVCYQELKSYPWTTLFLDGNHENFDILNAFPVSTWNGGDVHKIEDNIIHLMRGQIFQLYGNSFFVFGGGYSHDRYRRREGISWWSQELPSQKEVDVALDNLEKVGNKVDYILTHDCPQVYGRQIFPETHITMDVYPTNTVYTPKFFNMLKDSIDYKFWLNGHLHFDGLYKKGDTQLFLYDDFVSIVNGELVDIPEKYVSPDFSRVFKNYQI